jgi:uncharacterized membrane protein YebE (DUF533 family)
MFDVDRLIGRALSGNSGKGVLGGLLGGGGLGMLGSKRGRKLATQALKYGGIAAIGALAYHAYTRHKTGQPLGTSPTPTPSAAAQLPPDARFVPRTADPDAAHSVGVTLIRSMVAAAKADGEIDADEIQRLFAQKEQLDLSPDEKAFLLRELSRPTDLDAIVQAATSPALAAEIYTAALMAIEVSNPAESAFLQLLASRLKLEPGLVAELHRTVAENTVHLDSTRDQ